jgi:hypothetical protein
VDKSVDWKTAISLEAGKDAQGFVCPVKDQDFFKITVPAGTRLLHLQLQGSVSVTNVELTYLILREAGGTTTTVGQAPPWTGAGLRSFDDYHCIDPGTYYILVKDEGDDARDGTNPYTLRYTTEPDPDTNEPNDSVAAAKALGQPGYVSCKGDLDYHKVDVAADQLLEVKLTTQAATKVDLKYTIYDDQKNKLAEAGNPDGSKAPTNLTTIHALPKAGAYFIAVEDTGGDDSDPKVPYTLTATPKAEPDPQDKGTRNDTPATATKLSFAECQAGYTRTGQIASKADLDYFKIDGMPADMSPDNPGVIEVTVTYGAGVSTIVDPQIGLVYPHKGTPCTKDTCCRVLAAPCTSEFDCVRETFSCIKKEDIFCSDKDCAGALSTTCASELACAGAVTCLPEKFCGAEEVARADDNGEKDGASVRTAQPLLHPGPWYVRVGDLQNNDYDYGKNYTLTIKCRMDPEGANELNNEYFPNPLSSTINTADYHTAAAKKKGLKIVLGTWYTGYISYEGDQDWYLFDHPCPGADCNLQVNYRTNGSCPAGTGGSGLEFVYVLAHRDGDPWFSFPENPAPNLTGSYGGASQCLYGFAGDSGYYFYVTDYKHNSWSWDCSYSFQIVKTADGCNAPCVRKGNQNECST